MTGHRAGRRFGIWPVIAAMAVVAALWTAAAGLSFDGTSAVKPAMTCMVLEGLSLFYRHRRPDPRLAATLSAVAQTLACSAVGATMQYAVAATAGPLQDAMLLSWDRAFGLDWRGYLAFVNARPWLGSVYAFAYDSLECQLILVLVVLGFGSRAEAVQRFVSAFTIAVLITILISAVMPAAAMFVHLHLGAQDFPNLHPTDAALRASAFTALRDGTLRLVALDQMDGIITFPSLHAALGVMFTLALAPVRWLRWPVLVLNLLLIAATPIDGGHYFVDLMGGGLVAVLAMMAAGALGRGALPETAPPLLPATAARITAGAAPLDVARASRRPIRRAGSVDPGFLISSLHRRDGEDL